MTFLPYPILLVFCEARPVVVIECKMGRERLSLHTVCDTGFVKGANG